jgi:3-hydroxyisobutyrate dehydrogenase-like beta-hydroxyacid dehydrogenase
MTDIAFLGLGIMGQGMVHNLLQAGHRVTVWNRTPERAEMAVAQGATLATTAAEAVRDAEAVLYCFSDDRAVEEVVLAEDGIVRHVRKDALVVDLSTIDPATSDRERAAFEARGIRFLDAPVFGSRGEAATGGLWIVVGGDAEVLEEARPLLEPLSATIHHLGPGGSGARMKLVGNLLVASQLHALGEALSLARKAGLDLHEVLGVLAVTDFRTPIYDGVGAAAVQGDYSTDFSLQLMRKDAGLIAAFAGSLDVPVPTAELAIATLDRALEAGYGQENASALVKVLAADAGVSLEDGAV